MCLLASLARWSTSSPASNRAASGIHETSYLVSDAKRAWRVRLGQHLRAPHRHRPTGSAGKPTEFGHKIWLDEVEGGIITRATVLEGNPPEAPELRTSIAHHCRLFGHAPTLVAADRGLDDPANEAAATAAGVKRLAIPRKGAVSPDRRRVERQRWFREAQRWRAGMEGRISVCKRRGRLGRCRNRGQRGFDRWIGWSIFTENLGTIARSMAPRAHARTA